MVALMTFIQSKKVGFCLRTEKHSAVAVAALSMGELLLLWHSGSGWLHGFAVLLCQYSIKSETDYTCVFSVTPRYRCSSAIKQDKSVMILS